MKFVSGYQRMEQVERKYRDLDPISMTVPDQSMSVQDIINRSLAGLPTIGRDDAIFDDDDPDPVGGYDLTDLDPEKTESYKRAAALEKELYGHD